MTSRFRKRAILGFALLLFFGLSGCTSQTATIETEPDNGTLELIAAMGQRLQLMPHVARWKLKRNKAIRDLPRERIVLEGAVEAMEQAAREAGQPAFPKDAVRHFFQAQMDAAVAIQQNIFQRQSKSSEPALDLVTVIRPELDRLGRQIARLLVTQPAAADRDEVRRLAHQTWRIDGLESSQIDALAEALLDFLATFREREE